MSVYDTTGGSSSVNSGNQSNSTSGGSFWDKAHGELGDKPLPIDGDLADNIANATYY